jgi:hypothetical protein
VNAKRSIGGGFHTKRISDITEIEDIYSIKLRQRRILLEKQKLEAKIDALKNFDLGISSVQSESNVTK